MERIKKRNAEIFNRASENASHQLRREAHGLETFHPDVGRQYLKNYEDLVGAPFPYNSDVLELGCGNGHMILNLALVALMWNLMGLDISYGSLLPCADSASELAKSINLTCADGESVPYRSATFDPVIWRAFFT